MSKKPAKQLNAFKNVIVTGTIAGEDGRKMSKSLGNYTDPMELMDKFSADSLRFLLASSPLLSGEDFALKDKDVSDVARKLSMIWNMYDFFTMYAEVDGWEFEKLAKSFIMGVENADDDLVKLGIEFTKSDGSFGTYYSAFIPENKLKNFEKLIAEKMKPEFFNEYIIDGRGVFLFKLKDGTVERYVWSENERSSEKHIGELIAEMTGSFNGSIGEMWEENDFYGKDICKKYVLSTPQNLTNPLDQWIISRAHELRNHITQYMDAYNLPDAMSAILPFVDDASNWFVRRSRRRFWKSEDDSDKNDAYRTLHYVLVYLSQLLAPFAPFLAEELYQKLIHSPLPVEDGEGQAGGESVHLLDWLPEGEIDADVLDKMARTRAIIEKGLAIRMDREDEFGQIKVRQPLAKLEYDGEKLDDFYEQIIAEEVNVKSVIASAATQSSNNLSGLPRQTSLPRNDDATVVLDKKITPELKREGQAREVIRLVQNARKEAGLNVDDRIVVNITTPNPELQKALTKHHDTIAAEILATNFAPNYGHKTTAKIDEAEITIQLAKIEK